MSKNSSIAKTKILNEIIKLVLYFQYKIFHPPFSLAIGLVNSGKDSNFVTGTSSSLASALIIVKSG